ncbi:methionyl-tRNA formyltransferase [bacterium endosymbiont of Bathymodiolus sp. 5 South]|jgi:methionyl-tRNA formyltransferase|uniref:methionyl-tRNA formyltransferase n=1 Tax=bacterium endosymbiont of Bathymodiolus sp. 5 South TaxID=1181670 RepID=UPI0010B1A9EB|nr:methionyl-tRNA formyltransferase [bacterium endosymbiont of Bathymodiolus sp. 5 South]CAC9658235.1 Methionyl-tRNA formyltransferase (EC 2.1.2.9) [uncultured Gammaproteobacteria bacterium]CAC9660939.1 Methionyl-tRNA formyltransferase (EC 2.1.2.9) [uncultured Gammaproteobacteria bacterium]SHN92776.1 Methionyl-tRNA formyltransferase [bacterium endosymbiont of Bathymodiolus sp. 5 South]VVH58346.1 Methionyl-tRNA formyltransferase (EC [uncultured Gammaproteobacteria bacterium]
MRIVFAGTPEFSVGVLTALIDAGHNIVGVYCQPDRPKGRGRILTVCAVKEQALKHNLSVFQPESLKDDNAQKTLFALNADVMVVVAYGQLLPKLVLDTPKYGCLNIHASLLPRWRGAAPIQRAILAGDKTTGVCIMQMDEGLDTGNILLEKTCDITTTDTAQTLHDKLATLGAKAIIEALENFDNLSSTKQNEEGVTYAKKLKKDEAWIDWRQSADKINRQIRAFNPYPIAQSNATSDKFESKVLRILSANIVEKTSHEKPGEVIQPSTKGACYIATGNGILSLEQVQLSGKKIAHIKDFNNAYQLHKLGL